jgi:uncharacterized repeat protein (TIGR01451 family)
VTCSTNAAIFDTGYDSATGGVLAAGAPDGNWEAAQAEYDTPAGTSPATATALPPSNATWAPAVVGNVAPREYAASPYNDAQWISQQYSTPNQPAGGGDYYYRYQFDLDPAVEPSSFALSMNWLADNDVAEVFVNGTAQSPLTTGLPQNTSAPYEYAGYTAANAASTTLNHDWVTGENTIIVEIKSNAPEEAFDAQIRPSALCPTPSVRVMDTATVNPSSDQSDAQVGDQISYSYLVTNTGTVTLASVAVSDPSGAAVTCPTLAPPGLAPGASVTCTGTVSHVVTQDDANAGSVTDTVTATGTSSSGVQSGPSAPASAVVPVAAPGSTTTGTTTTGPAVVPVPGGTTTGTTTTGPTVTRPRPVPPTAASSNLRLTKTAATATVPVGSDETYTLVVTNLGPSSASRVTVTDTLPSGLTFASASKGCTHAGATVTCRVASLSADAPRNTATFKVVARVGPGAAAGIDNRARVSSSTPDHDELNNSATAKVKALLPILGLSETAQQKTVPDGAEVDYTLRVHNAGKGLLTHAIVCDPLPAGTTVVQSKGARVVNGELCWTIKRLAPGHELKLKLTLDMAASTLSGALVNHVTATADGVTRRRVSAVVTVVPGPAPRPEGVTG